MIIMKQKCDDLRGKKKGQRQKDNWLWKWEKRQNETC